MKESKFDARGVRLSKGQKSLMIHPLAQVPGLPSPPASFPLPEFPLSQCVWLNTLTHTFRDRHRRCLAVTLMVDARSRRWVRPELPTQRCSRDGVAWTLRPENYEDRPPHVLIGGSYQMAVAGTFDEVLSRVPPFDDLHIVNVVRRKERQTFSFLTIGGEPHFTPPHFFLADDWTAVIEAHDDRLRLI
jgi:hypothetical protein